MGVYNYVKYQSPNELTNTNSLDIFYSDQPIASSNLNSKYSGNSVKVRHTVNSPTEFNRFNNKNLIIFSTSLIGFYNHTTRAYNQLTVPNLTSFTSLGMFEDNFYIYGSISNNLYVIKVDSSGLVSTILTLPTTPSAPNPTVCRGGKYIAFTSEFVAGNNTVKVYDLTNLSTLVYSKSIASVSMNIVIRCFPDSAFLNNASSTLVHRSTSTVTAPSNIISSNITHINQSGIAWSVGSGLTSYQKYNLTTYSFTNPISARMVGFFDIHYSEGFYNTSASGGVGFVNTNTDIITSSLYPIFSADDGVISSPYKHNIVLDETLVATNFKVKAIDLSTGNIVSEATITGTGGDILLPTINHHMITVYPDIGNQFQPLKVYSTLNELVYPYNTTQFPYYFKVTSTGTAGVTEPAWSTTANSTTSSGSVVFTVVEQIPNTSAKFPVLPEPV